MNILVTGGTGYIGSHTIVDLIEKGYTPICVDNQSNSDLSVLDGIEQITGVSVQHYSIDLCEIDSLDLVFEENTIHGVIHFAALKSVGESVEKPLEYYYNNITSLNNLLFLCQAHKVSNVVFSSSCSVYGNTTALPVKEDTPFGEAECPYARTKQIGEQMITDFGVPNTWFKSALLRYFNPAGAHESALIGESAKQIASNLVPVITESGIGKRKEMKVFGSDYNTRDGSCIRDYIHVMDLANAHTKALAHLMDENNTTQIEVFNLGIGQGVTVLEAIHAFEAVSGIKLNYTIGERRAGDIEAIYASTEKSTEVLKWQPTRSIGDIMKSAWAWEQVRSKT